MNIAFYIGKRYLYSKSSNNVINIISLIAIAGIIISSASLLIVLSGFTGLRDFTLQYTNVIDPDLKAIPKTGKSFIITPEQLTKLNQLSSIDSYSKGIEERAFLGVDNKKKLVTIKGVDSQFSKVNDVQSILYNGSWVNPEMNQIVAGWTIANDLSFGILDFAKKITLFVPKAGKGQITSLKNAFNSVETVNVGIFDVNENLNKKYVYTNLEVAQKLLNYSADQLSFLEFKLKEDITESEAINQLNTIFGDTLIYKNRIQLNTSIYKMLNTENIAVYLIFTLVLIIALFNVIGSIIMMILDKKKNLNTLYNLGVSIQTIRNIFFVQGSLMSICGGIIGLFIGLLFVWSQHQFQFLKITPTLAYPMRLTFQNVLIVFGTILFLGIIASKIASARITPTLVNHKS